MSLFHEFKTCNFVRSIFQFFFFLDQPVWVSVTSGTKCYLRNTFLCFDVGLHCKAQQMIFFSHTVSCWLEFIITFCLLLLLKHSFFHSFLLSPNVSFCRSQTGVHIFTKRPKSRNGSNLSPDDVVTYLGKHSRALLLYLEHLVLEEKIQVQMDSLISSWRPMWPGGFRVSKSIQPRSQCSWWKQKLCCCCCSLLYLCW